MSNNQGEDKIPETLISVINKLMLVIVVLVVALIAIPIVFYYSNQPDKSENITSPAITKQGEVKKDKLVYWTATDINTITDAKQKEQVTYGKELITHTSKYYGPKGSILQITNGLNCQNCHLQAGTAVFANNYGSVASLFPKLRARSGKIETVYKRVNDCFERSLNGKAIDTAGKEMQAIVAYINFIGSNVEKGKKAEGSGFKDLAYLDRAAEPQKGQSVYTAKCQSCHQPNGEGLFNADKTEYNFPALWGPHSYNDGAGLYRISNIAKYVKYNMPQGTTYRNPQLTDEEAWDVAAYITSQPRPHINEPKDWPDISKKPVDHPFGPYADNFPEQQHKYGPFKPISDLQKKETITNKSSSK
jgi:thiosulfate dehydrogenase